MFMEIISARFLQSQSSGQALSFSLPQIAVVGRSNVGKSSFLNMISNSKKLAKTSSTPGRTRLINYFEFTVASGAVRKKFVFTDLPGYGFAKVSTAEQNRWKQMIEDYFATANNLKCVILLLDIRHLPSLQDHIMFDFLFRKNLSVTIVATKADKLSKSQVDKAITDIAAALKVGKGNIIVSSSQTRQGKQQILSRLWQFICPEKIARASDEVSNEKSTQKNIQSGANATQNAATKGGKNEDLGD